MTANQRSAQFANKAIVDVIRQRRSVRTFTAQPPSAGALEALAEYAATIRGPFQARVRLELLDRVGVATNSRVKLGTYGVIQGATHFIAVAATKGPRSEEQVGYVLEQLVLYATALGLGTCWLGGTFDRSAFGKAINLQAGEYLPVVTPVGIPSATRSPLDALFHGFARSSSRRPWRDLFFNAKLTPLTETDAGEYATPLEMIRLAPSASNKQPWRVVMEGRRLHLYLARDRIYRRALPYDIQKIDMGIAMCHLEMSAREGGLSGAWSSAPPTLSGLPAGWEHVISWVTAAG